MKTRRYLTILIVMFHLLIMAGIAYADDIRVAWNNYDKFQEYSSNRLVKSGYGYDVYQKLADYTGWKYKYIYGGQETLYNDFLQGKIDFYGEVLPLGVLPSDGPFKRHEIGVVNGKRYFISVRQDAKALDETLTTTLARIQKDSPDFYNILAKKYTMPESAHNRTAKEEQWLATHEDLRIGYSDTYMPFSSTNPDGSVTGVLDDIVKEWLKTSGLENRLKVKFIPYGHNHYNTMINDLSNDKIDAVFPIIESSWYSELCGLMTTDTIVSSSIVAVYSGVYEPSKLNTIATASSAMQYICSNDYFPNSKQIVCATRDECLDKVLSGEIGSTLFNDTRAREILTIDKYSSLKYMPLGRSVGYGFGVKKGNLDLLSLLNRGIRNLHKSDLNHKIYDYATIKKPYTTKDFLNDNLIAVFLVALVILSLVIYAYFQKSNASIKEQLAQAEKDKLVAINKTQNKHIEEVTGLNNQLEASLNEQKIQLEEITFLNDKLKDNQDRLEAAVESARVASHAKSDFLSRMSHDIRTPMNAIVGMTEIAKRHVDDSDKVMDCLKKIDRESQHLQTLINDVLDISAIESGKLTIRKEVVRIAELVENMNVAVNSLAKAKNVDYTYEQGNIFFPYINADGLRISQVILNLLSNAIKFTPTKGKVKFELWQGFGDEAGAVKLHVRVSDTGIGMTADFMENMYSEFARAVDSRVNKVQGTGLGLAIVKQIVDMMKGTIEVQSEINRGTTFYVVLPLEAIEKTDSKEEAIEDKLDFSIFKGLKVLIAEDNDLNYEIAYELLSDYGMQMTRAEDGAIALDLMKTAEPGTYDLILMDIQMPVMNGLESTKAIRAIEGEYAKCIPIIAMTANAFAEDALACRKAGMDSHVGKPINVKFLLETVIRVLKEKKK